MQRLNNKKGSHGALFDREACGWWVSGVLSELLMLVLMLA